MIVDSHSARRWKRFQPQVIEALDMRLRGTPAEQIAQAAEQPIKRAALEKLVTDVDAFGEAIKLGLLLALPDDTYIAAASARVLLQWMMRELTTFHQAQPLRLGMPREELRSKIGLKSVTLTALLDIQNQIVAEGNILRLKDHAIHFDAGQTASIALLQTKIETAPYTPPSFSEAAK